MTPLEDPGYIVRCMILDTMKMVHREAKVALMPSPKLVVHVTDGMLALLKDHADKQKMAIDWSTATQFFGARLVTGAKDFEVHPDNWEAYRTDETKNIERLLKEAGFNIVHAYRFNSASIRVRVVDKSFEGQSRNARIKLVCDILDKQLPEKPAGDIGTMFLYTTAEYTGANPPLDNAVFEEATA